MCLSTRLSRYLVPRGLYFISANLFQYAKYLKTVMRGASLGTYLTVGNVLFTLNLVGPTYEYSASCAIGYRQIFLIRPVFYALSIFKIIFSDL